MDMDFLRVHFLRSTKKESQIVSHEGFKYDELLKNYSENYTLESNFEKLRTH